MKNKPFKRILKGAAYLITGPVKQNLDSQDGGVGKIDYMGLVGTITAIGIVILAIMGKVSFDQLLELLEALK